MATSYLIQCLRNYYLEHRYMISYKCIQLPFMLLVKVIYLEISNNKPNRYVNWMLIECFYFDGKGNLHLGYVFYINNLIMNYSKDKVPYNVCKSHKFKSEKDLYRLCPSKLSKEDLENFYFVLLDSNNQQKKMINRQLDEIKILRTKLQRKAGEKVVLGNNDCCNRSRVIINEQKESLADIQKANERLSDKIKILNMRLCSAKQFLRRGSQSASYCSKCFSSTSLLKNISTSALGTKRSESNLYMTNFNREKGQPIKLAHNISTQVDMSPRSCNPDICEENKCRNTIDELKQKIFNLDEVLAKSRVENMENMKKMETDVNGVHKENIRVRAECFSILEKFKEKEKECVELLQELRNSESQCDNLNADLLIEKSKVSELETQIKASDISEQITRALEVHMKKSVLLVPNNITSVEDKTISNIASEDSGYIDTNKSQESNKKESSGNSEQEEETEEVTQHIASLQAQLDNIKRSLEAQKQSTDDHEYNNDMSTNLKYLNKSNMISSSSQVRDDISVSTGDLTPKNNLNGQNISKIPLPIKPSHISNLSGNINKLNTTDKNNTIQNTNEIVNNMENNDNINNNEINLLKDENMLESTKNEVENHKLKPNFNKNESDYNINIDNNNKYRIHPRKNDYETKDAFVNETNDKIKDTNEYIENSSGHNTFVIEKQKSKKSRVKTVDVDVNVVDVDTKSKLKPLATSSPTRLRNSIFIDISDKTDCEISSLTDITNDKSPIDYISPGEERFMAFSNSTITTTDYHSLSEGELPVNEVKKNTIAEVVMKDIMTDFGGKTSQNKMEEALNAVGTELMKCRELLYTGRNKSTLITNIEKIHKFSYPYNFTLPLQ